MGDWLLRYRAILQMLAGAFLISFSAIFVRLADVAPTCSGFYRVFFGFLFLLVIAIFKKDLTKPRPLQIILIAFCGLTFALDLFFWHESIIYIGPGLATLLGNFQVFLLAATAIFFFGEKARPRFLASLPIAILGLFLIVGLDWQRLSNTYKTGVYFGLLTALCYTVYLLSLKKIQIEGSRSPVFSLMLVSLFCAFFLGLKMTLTGDSFHIPNLKSLLSLLCLGFFCQTIGWMLIAGALSKIQTSLIGLMLLLQPSLSFFWDVLFFSRPTSFVNWIGVFLTLAAIYMGLTGKAPRGSSPS
ncbi:MAG: DMT family transporter [Proteobacteria bacterium]|nr:DMT family transporter [Pseudomonadota bacterium]